MHLGRSLRWHPLASIVDGLPPALRYGGLGLFALRRSALRLIADRRFDEAETLLAHAVARRPKHRKLATAFALAAHNRGHYTEAITRWTRAIEVGGKPFCSACLAANFRILGRHESAQALIDQALGQHPDDLTVLTEAARLAEARHRSRDSAQLWRQAIRIMRRPHPDWLQGYGQSLFFLGHFALAERVLASARRQFPEHQGLRAAAGAILVARQEWPRAVAFWTDYRRRHPDDATGWQQLGIALQGQQMSVVADAAVPALPALADIAIVEDEPMRRLVLRFESIGDSCEMGLVQRRYSAEPLGLLRWNDVRLENLVTALEHGLEGMGAPEHTEIVTASNGEFYVKDRRWSLTMHTFLFADHVDESAIYMKMCRRIVFLRDKLLEDLRAADKIFVYRSPDFDDMGLRRLHRALRALGPVTLLGAQPVLTPVTRFPGRPVGQVAQLDEGLYLGFLGRPGSNALGQWDIAFDDWTSIFAKALAAETRVTA